MSINLFAFIVVLGVLIFFHELGHFLVARLFGVGVEKFSLGFGPRLFGKKIGITDYRISLIPLGGYVKMVGEEPDAEIDPADIPISFTQKNVFKRIFIVAAGPAFNILLAIVIFFCFYLISGIEYVTPVIRTIETDGPAHKAGLKKNDLILSIDNARVDSWYDILKAVERGKERPLLLDVRRGDSIFTAEVSPNLSVGKDFFGDDLEYYTLGISGFPEQEAIVGEISEGFPAQKAGLKKGDKIVAINDNKIDSWNGMRTAITASEGDALKITVLRDDTRFDVEITPTLKNAIGETEKRYQIGISSPGVKIPDDDKFVKRLNPLTAFRESIAHTYNITKLTVIIVGKLIQGKVSAKTIGGPIMIAQMAGQQAREGVTNLAFFIALISINLAILNFLPIPVLDGGHLLFFSIEAVIGRPVNIKVREIAQQAGIFVLILLMIYVFYNDIVRLIPK
jgi:regulator of sigma E protease